MNNKVLAMLGEGTGVANTEAGFGKLFTNAFGLVLTVGAFFVLYQLVLGALNWINSQGDKDKITKAQKQITNALIGLVILFVVWVLFFTITSDILGLFKRNGDGTFQLTIPSLFK